MGTKFGDHFSSRKTLQTQPIPGEQMEQNRAGGFAFPVSCWTQLERFCILGSEGGTYYASEQEMTVENAQNVLTCLQADGKRAVDTVVSISDSGRAAKNDPALFVLALATRFGDEGTRRYAFDSLPKVARIGTHLEHFAAFMAAHRGWGRGARRAVGNWFLDMPVDRLALQAIKYPQRDGWALRDLLRLSHPKTEEPDRNAVFNYITQGEVDVDAVPDQIRAAKELTPVMALTPKGRAQAIALITEYRLPREAIPTQLLNCVEVWDALLQNMPMTAMIRNLGKMSQVGLMKPLSEASRFVVRRLGSDEALEKARVHPINVLAALMTYNQGHGMRGKLSWEPVPQVVDALDTAFYTSFKFVEPTGKRFLIGLDVSGSMASYAAQVNGMPFLRAREASAAMCMVTARTEQDWHIMGFSHRFEPLAISPRQRLDDVVRTVTNLRFGATDCSLPMRWALQNKVSVDAFVIYTDCETYWGDEHPMQSLQRYRDAMGIPAKLVTCAMTATKFSIGKREGRGYGYIYQDDPPAIADPNDGGTLDIAGLDSAAPQIISNFVQG